MIQEQPVGEQGVRTLARAADLPLSEDRLPAVAVLLDSWLVSANELSRTMSAVEHLALVPATVFTHPMTEPTE